MSAITTGDGRHRKRASFRPSLPIHKRARRRLSLKACAEERERAVARLAVDTINAVADGVVLCDIGGGIISINSAMETLTGYARDEWIGRPASELLKKLLIPKSWPKALRRLAALQRGQLPALPPATLVSKEGRHLPVLVTASFLRNAEGKPRAIVATVKDISSLKRAEITLRRSERKYRELVENANSIIMRRKRDGTIVFFNEFAQRQMAYWDWSFQPVKDETGKLDGFLLCLLDVTERKRALQAVSFFQNEVRTLSSELFLAEESTRRQVAVALHDTVGQMLA